MASWFFTMANYREQTGTRLGSGRKDDGWTYNLLEVDTATGVSKLVRAGTAYTTDWVLDRNNQPVARVDWNPDGQRFSILYQRGEGWTEIFKLTTGERPIVRGETDDGSLLIL